MASQFANFICASQKALKYDNREFAKRLNISCSTLYRWKNDRGAS